MKNEIYLVKISKKSFFSAMEEHIFIHIGYPKSASTTLQINLFSKHPQIAYLGKHYKESCRNGVWERDKRIWEIINKNILIKNEWQKKHWSNIKDKENYGDQNDSLSQPKVKDQEFLFLNQLIRKLKRKRLVLSHEGFLNGGWQPIEEVPFRLKQAFPNASILIILRNQVNLIESYYWELKQKSYLSSDSKKYSFEDWMDLELQNLNRSFLRSLNYNETIKVYQQLFGTQNVYCFLMEDLKYAPELFSEKLSKILNIDSKTTFQLLNSPSKNLSKNKKYYNEKLLKWNFAHLEQIKEIFGIGNKNLIQEYNLHLNRYNYPIA